MKIHTQLRSAIRAGVLSSTLLASASTYGVVLNLNDVNSSVAIDSSDGVVSWTVDGQNQLVNQWFWYRTGSDTREYSIDTIGGFAAITSNGDFDAGDEKGILRYGNASFGVDVTYTLVGGSLGSGTADLAEQIQVFNFTNAPLDFTFFQYSDFELGGNALDDSVLIQPGAQVITQTDPFLSIQETVVTPAPDLFEANTGSSTLDALEDMAVDNLNTATVSGPDDVTWALQWNFEVPAATGEGYENAGSLIISKDKQLTAVPEPGTYALVLGCAAFVWLALQRRRS